MERVLIYAPRRQLLLMLLGSAAFVAGGLWMLSTGGPVGFVIGVLAIAFFGLGGVYYLIELVYRRPILQVDADGIVDRASLASAGRLEWRDIAKVRIYSVGTQRMLELTPRDLQSVIARAGPLRRAVQRANYGAGFPALNIPEHLLPYPLEALVSELRRHNPDLQLSGD